MNDEYDIAAAREIAIGERECREQVQADNEQKPPKSWAVIHLERARAENARLRALLALCVATMEAVSDDDRLELTHLDDPHYSRHTVSIGTLRDVRDRLNTAIAAAKEAIR